MKTFRYRSREPAERVQPRGRAPALVRDRMNRGERRYAAYLDALCAAGTVSVWYYEPLSWRLADNTHYRPDFLVILADGSVELHEVKGRKSQRRSKRGELVGQPFWAQEDSWLKLKIVAEIIPFGLIIVWQEADGSWSQRRLAPTPGRGDDA